MDATSNTGVKTIDEYIDGLVKDSPDVLYKLNKLVKDDDAYVEMAVELPAMLCPDIIIGNIQRWREVQLYFHKDLRIYAWSYSTEVEKFVQGCVSSMSDIYVTILPMYLKEIK